MEVINQPIIHTYFVKCISYFMSMFFILLLQVGISRLSGETKQLADPEILRRLTSSVR